MGRLLPHPNILSVFDALEAGKSLYPPGPLHSNGFHYGNITLNSVLVNADAVLKLSSYGDAQIASEEKFREDITSGGSILARLLLEEESFLKLSIIKSHNDLEWRTILQGNVEPGLVDFHARNMLYLLLGSMLFIRSPSTSLYAHFRKNVGKVPLIEAEHKDLSALSLNDVHGLLRGELNRYESPISIQDVQ